MEQTCQALLDAFAAAGYSLVNPSLIEPLSGLKTGCGQDGEHNTFKLIDHLYGIALGVALAKRSKRRSERQTGRQVLPRHRDWPRAPFGLVHADRQIGLRLVDSGAVRKLSVARCRPGEAVCVCPNCRDAGDNCVGGLPPAIALQRTQQLS